MAFKGPERGKMASISFIAITLIITFPLTNVLHGAEYPNKPIQLVIAYPPGGGADTCARIITNKISHLLRQPVVVVNKPGGGAVIGTSFARSAPPDGYTIFIAQPPMLRHPLTTKGVTYDITRDFIPINLAVSCNMVTVVKQDAPWNSLQELISEAKKNPGKLAFSSPGYGSTAHFTMEMLKIDTGTDFTHVPMDGTSPAITAVLGGHTQVFVAELGVVYKYIEARSLKALVVWSKMRDKMIPLVPTTTEEGLPRLLETSWQAFLVPLKTPDTVVRKLEGVFKEAMEDKEIIAKYERIGWGTIENLGSKDTANFLARCQKRYVDVARTMNMVPQ